MLNNNQAAIKEFEKQSSRFISLGESSVTFNHCSYPIIGSYDANPSVIMAIHSPAYQVSAMAHIDQNTDIQAAIKALTAEVSSITKELYDTYKAEAAVIEQSRTRLQKWLHTLSSKIGLVSKHLPIHPRDPNLPPLNVHLSSGSKQLNTTMNQLREQISRNSKLQLKSVHQQTGLAIDSRSGKVYTGSFSEQHFMAIAPTSTPLPSTLIDNNNQDMRQQYTATVA